MRFLLDTYSPIATITRGRRFAKLPMSTNQGVFLLRGDNEQNTYLQIDYLSLLPFNWLHARYKLIFRLYVSFTNTYQPRAQKPRSEWPQKKPFHEFSTIWLQRREIGKFYTLRPWTPSGNLENVFVAPRRLRKRRTQQKVIFYLNLKLLEYIKLRCKLHELGSLF